MFLVFELIGKYCNGNGTDIIKIAFEPKSNELLVVHFESEEMQPSFVSRFLCDSTSNPSTEAKFTMVNYKSNRLDSCPSHSMLQKIELQVKMPYMKEPANGWSLTISEFNVETDYFHEIPPDSEKKLARKITLGPCSKFAGLDVEIRTCEVTQQKTFLRKDKLPGLKNIFDRLPDRKHGETLARSVFDTYRDEVWLKNDGFLSSALSKAEEDYRAYKLRQIIASRRQPLETDKSLAEDAGGACLTEDEIWESRPHGHFLETDERLYYTEANVEVNSEDTLHTEDEIWESRDPEQAPCKEEEMS